LTETVLTGQAAVDELVTILTLTRLAEQEFRGRSPSTGQQRVYGGLVAAQALVAAGSTVPASRQVHSLHGYFVRPGQPGQTITYQVESIRDGRSFSVRRCTAWQHDRPIFLMSASFASQVDGIDHQTPAPLDVPLPEDLPTMMDRLAKYPQRLDFWSRIPQPIDVRYVGESGWVTPGNRPAELHQRVWMRIDGTLPDDPLLHACAMTYASDLTLLDAVLSVHGEVWGPGGMVGASLDHALWFHRPFRADEWFLYDCWSPSAAGGRGLATGRMFTLGGQHVASVVQEGIVRRMRIDRHE
jgi:acyl-CoA thioesterase-2